MIKVHDTVGYEYVVAEINFTRNDPLGMKSVERRGFEIDTRHSMTCAMSEKEAVTQLPPTLQVLLDTWLQSIHVVIIAPPKRNGRLLRPA